jgi:type VI secretion system protein ImpK
VTAILSLTFGGISLALGSQTERLLGQMASVDPGLPPVLERPAPPPPPPPPPPGPDQVQVVSGFLEKEITAKTILVYQDANTLTVRVNGNGMFGSGSDSLKPEVVDMIERISKALNNQKGKVLVIGHSDNVPIRSSRFPSNMHLSLARADSVKKLMAVHIDDPSRVSAEGRADKEPLEPNTTKAGQAANRRIEIVLLREES